MKFTTCLWQNIDKNNTAVTSILTSRWWSKSYQESSSHCRQQFLQCAKLVVWSSFPQGSFLSHPQLRWTPAWHPCWRWSQGLCWHWQFCGTWKVTKLSLSSSCPKLSSASRVCCGWWHPHRDEDGWPALVPGCRSGSGQSWHHPSPQLGTQL